MLAEIHGKVNRDHTNLTELREDELTGNLFGCLRYISFDKGMKKILRNAVRPAALRSFIDTIDVCEWNENLFLWHRICENDRVTELDVYMEFEAAAIGIEVKYKSGLSSEDWKDRQEVSAADSQNQLSREARAMQKAAPEKKKILLLLAEESVCAETISEVKMPKEVKLGFLSWQEVLQQLKVLTDLDVFERLIVADLIELLEKKGFVRFRSFDALMPKVNREQYWSFECLKKRESFAYDFGKTVDRELYFRFCQGSGK